MRKIKSVCLLMIMVVLLSCLCACQVDENATFNGSKTGDEKHFDIEFEILNDTYSHDLFVNEGDNIEVSIERTSGSISVSVQNESGDSVYRGDDVDTCKFDVVISEGGTYTLRVTGKKAKGHVAFTRIENANVLVEESQPSTEDSAMVNVDEDQNDNSLLVDKIVGPWYLDDSEMDMEMIGAAFPGIEESGHAMEIRSDGRLSWHVGSDGAVGTYEIDGNNLNATFTSDADGTTYTTKLEYQEANDLLIMNYKDFAFVWKHE